MKTIVMLDGTERVDGGTLAATASADVVIDERGAILVNKGGATGHNINLTELRRVLETKARPRKGKEP